jgi:hypothetical protein
MSKRKCSVEKESYWRRQVEDWERSGSQVRAFCRDRQLMEASFYFWRKRLRCESGDKLSPARDSIAPDFTAHGVHTQSARPKWVPLTITEVPREKIEVPLAITEVPREKIEVSYPSGLVLRFPIGLPREAISELLGVLKESEAGA